jgi:hypothetical protein
MRAVQTAHSGQIKKNEDSHAEGLTDAERIVKVLQKVDEISRAISVSSKSSVPAADEKDIELNLGQEAPAQLLEAEKEVQKVRMLEAEKEVETMRIRALEAEKLVEVLQRDLDAMRAVASDAAQIQASINDKEPASAAVHEATGQKAMPALRETPAVVSECVDVTDAAVVISEQNLGLVNSDCRALSGQLAQVVNSIGKQTSDHDMNPNGLAVTLSIITLLEEIAISHNDVLKVRQQLQDSQDSAEKSAEVSARGFRTSLQEWQMREQDILSQLSAAKQKLQGMQAIGEDKKSCLRVCS